MEILRALHDWRPHWKRLFVKRETSRFGRVKEIIDELTLMRHQLQVDVLTQEQLRELRIKIGAQIDLGNKILDLDLVPREESGKVPKASKVGPVHLWDLFDSASRRSKKQPLSHRSSTNSNSGMSAILPSSPSATTLTTESVASPHPHPHHHPPSSNPSGIHLILRFDDLLIPPGKQDEEIEIFFSLYHKSIVNQSAFISERAFLSPVAQTGDFVQSSVLFWDILDSMELCKSLYVVVQMYKNGNRLIIHNENARRTSSGVGLGGALRRPFGVAVLGPFANIAPGSSPEFDAKIFLCEDKDFHHMHELILKNGALKSLCHGSKVGISLQLLRGDSNQLRKDHKRLLRSSIDANKIGFPNVIFPGDVRNDLYLTIEQGYFERSGKARNIEVSAVIVGRNGQVIEDKIHFAAGLAPATRVGFPVMFHSNSPIWMETLRLEIPIDKFEGAHIRLEYRHCSNKERSEKKLLGFSFVHLMEADRTTIKDGSHSLCIYKCEDQEQLTDSSIYLPLVARLSEVRLSDQVTVHRGFVRSTKESITIKTRLCSTKLTQNVHLMSLLNWKSNPEQIQDTLKRIMLIEGEEIVKFLQDILDALFEMFTTEDGDSTGHSGLVFQVLVYIISSLHDPKFKHFGPILDTYINEHFSAALVYKGLLTCLRHFTDHVSSKENQEPIQKCFQSVEYIMKFVIRSRLLFIRTSVGATDNSFRDSVKLLFDSFNKMLSHTNENFQGTQVMFLKNISAVFPHILRILPVIDVAEFVTLMFVTLNHDLPHPVSEAMLAAIHQTINSPVFQDIESRNLFLPTCCDIVKKYLVHKQQLQQCSDILADMLTFFHLRQELSDEGHSVIFKDVVTLSEKLLTPLINIILNIDGASSLKGRLVACLLSLLQLMEEDHFKNLWDLMYHKSILKTFLLESFLLLQALISQPIFPRSWNAMKLLTSHVLMNALQELAKPLLIYFREEHQFDRQLWMNYFTLAVNYLSQSELQLEKVQEMKRQYILQQFGDMRMRMAFQILSLWSHLGDLKQFFVPGIVGPLLKMTSIPDVELRKSALPVFYDLLDYEHRLKGHFKQIECELVDKLDILVQENKADENYKQLFDTMLRDVLEERDPAWKGNGKSFIESVTSLLERLLDYRNALQSDDSREKEMSCIVNLLQFYKAEPNRVELFLRYIYKLHDLHLPAENFVEAAFTLKLHADLLEWTNRSLHADLRYPSQKEWERKEQLYLNIIDLLEKGKHWEHAVPLCKELSMVYESKVFNYRKLAEILKRQASFFEKIISSSEQNLRLSPEYFRVGFYGNNFPPFLKNKEFVYRGLEFEKLPAFQQRISDEFPQAQILPTNTQPDETICNQDGQFIQICCVKPVPDEAPQDQHHVTSMEGLTVPSKIQKSQDRMSISKFVYDRPFHQGKRDKGNEFKTLWLERTSFQCNASFPGVLRWFEVVDSNLDLIPPIQHACETIQAKNLEIQHMINDPLDQPIQKLSLSLQGVIDAAVNGGIFKYQEAFFAPEFINEHPEHGEEIPRLKRLMIDQVSILDQALKQHERLISPEVRPLHDHLISRWRNMKDSLETLPESPMPMQRRSSSLNKTPTARKGPLPPLPNHPSEETYSSAIRKRSSVALRASLSSLYGHSNFIDGTSRSSQSNISQTSNGSSSSANESPRKVVGESIYSRPNDQAVRAMSNPMSISMNSLPNNASPGGNGSNSSPSRSIFDRNDYQQIDVDDFLDEDEGIRLLDAPPLPPRISTLNLPERPRNRTSLASAATSSGIGKSPPPIPPKSSSASLASPPLSSASVHEES
ncbi:dedicator of cytokinesis protein 3-like [Tigriopus californicus]|uniref:dedicator of cytokinesis protein 3-like n=1 Tax=Tigriopus californicus TaxID=6832 RepID=UPI0027DA2D75|nr:dedicator of cytokinesis protein 3-like [Tigriopus californicus]